ncbi:MAG: M23 family metallopeptidase [Fusobacterium sp.]|nr:M23 family metallopeptidase [Fusobacterium sp.]
MIKKNKQLELLERLKEEKIEFFFGEKNYDINLKKSNFLHKIYFKRIFIYSLFILLVSTNLFLYKKYNKEYTSFKEYKRNTEELVFLGENYKKELLLRESEKIKKKSEIKDLKDLSLNKINNLPKEKKEIFLNIIPNGNPLDKKIHITSPFGMRIHPITKIFKMHEGIDLRLNIGDSIFSTAMGKVSFTGKKNGYGQTIIIDHFFGFQTVYAHLSEINVKIGEKVGKGKLIGKGGSSGLSTGPHLHYEVRYLKEPLDPKNFIDWNINNFNIIFEKELKVEWESFLTIMGKN